MRVLRYSKAFSELTETFVYDSVVAAQAHGVETRVATLERKHPDARPFGAVSVLERQAQSSPLQQIAELQESLKELVAESGAQILHGHFGGSSVLLHPVAKATGVPLLLSFHGFDAFRLPLSQAWRQRYAALWQDKGVWMTTVSEHMRDQLIELGARPERVTVIRSGKVMERFSLVAPTRAPRRWLSIGRFVEKKGHQDTLAAFGLAAQRYPDATLSLVGEGPLFDETKAWLSEQPIAERVQLHGALDHSQILRMLSESEAFILSSRTATTGDMEGVPNVLMEAMACGLPCVSTFHAGIPELLPASCLAKEGAVDVLAEKMIALMERSPQSLAEEGASFREIVEQRFNLEQEVEKLAALYGRIAASSHDDQPKT